MPSAVNPRKNAAADASTRKTLAVERENEPAVKASIVQPAATEAPVKAMVSSAPAGGGNSIDAVTVTGCLESDAERFWLKDPSGAGAPKQRSWKSGFLRKRPQPIEVVNGTNSLRLSSYVGQRVAATGSLINSDMHADSLRRVSGACD